MRQLMFGTRRLSAVSLATAVLVGTAACSSAAPRASSVSPSDGPRTTQGATATTSAAPPSVAPAEIALVEDVDVGGGRTIHVSCLGTAPAGVPTVVFISGLGAGAEAANPIFYGVAETTRICAYDRAGLGQSPPVSGGPPTSSDQVSDLAAALAGAGIDGPIVLVAHSYGAYLASLLAQGAPEDVAGVVFADPRGPRVSAKWLAALPAPAAGEAAAVAANRDELTRGETDPSLNPEGIDLAASAVEATKVLDAPGPLFGDRPVIVLSGALTKQSWADLPPAVRASFDAIWLGEQRALAEESTKGELRVIAESDHDLVGRDPDAVIKAIEDVLAAL